jgi:hypothetical protein
MSIHATIKQSHALSELIFPVNVAARATSRLLKNSLAARFQDGVVAVVEGELDFDAAVVFEFG